MGNLFQELKRRRVFRVAAVYAVVSWVVIQVATTLFPTFQLPDWTVTFVTFLLILGFFPTMVVAWAHEITPQGIQPEAGTVSVSTAAISTDRKLIYATFVLVLIVAGFQVAERVVLQQSLDFEEVSSTIGQEGEQERVRRGSIRVGTRGGSFLATSDVPVSRAGDMVAYGALDDNVQKLYLRNLAEREATVIEGSEELIPIVFSPDGTMLLARDGRARTLAIVDLRTNQIQRTSLGSRSSFGWDQDNNIIYTDIETSTLFRTSISAEPGEPLNIPRQPGEVQLNPHFLPTGNALLYTVASEVDNTDPRVDLFDFESMRSRTIVSNGYDARYVNSGHIIFVRSRALWAIPFDVGTYQTTGVEVRVIEEVQTSEVINRATYGVGDNGLLIYSKQIQDYYFDLKDILPVWVNHQGEEESLDIEPGRYSTVQASPNGRWISYLEIDGNRSDIWLYDIAQRNPRRLTFGESIRTAIWSPDSEWLAAGSSVTGGLWSYSVNGAGQPEFISNSLIDQRAETFSPDSSSLVYRAFGSLGFDLFDLSLSPETIERPLLTDDSASVAFSKISPDGRWIAYSSNQTGDYEVYVSPYPNVGGGVWPISNGGGEEPTWSPSGDEIYYRNARRRTVEKVEIDIAGDSIITGRPIVLFPDIYWGIGARPSYDISADGEKFLMQKSDAYTQNEAFQNQADSYVLSVDNWFQELRQLAPPDAL
jgi:WD40 repeat protein